MLSQNFHWVTCDDTGNHNVGAGGRGIQYLWPGYQSRSQGLLPGLRAWWGTRRIPEVVVARQTSNVTFKRNCQSKGSIQLTWEPHLILCGIQEDSSPLVHINLLQVMASCLLIIVTWSSYAVISLVEAVTLIVVNGLNSSWNFSLTSCGCIFFQSFVSE